MKTNNILFRRGSLLFMPFLLTLLIGFVACSSDDDKADKYADVGLIAIKPGDKSKLTPLPEGYRIDATGGGSGTVDFYLYSNIGKWILEVEPEAKEWVQFWPGEGVDDGLFSVQVLKNDTFTPRSATFRLVADNKTYMTIPIDQAAGDASLSISPKTKKVPVEGSGGPYEVVVTTNVGWTAALDNPADASWVKIVETTPNSIRYLVFENTADAAGAPAVERIAKINFVGVDNLDKKEILIITQAGAEVQ